MTHPNLRSTKAKYDKREASVFVDTLEFALSNDFHRPQFTVGWVVATLIFLSAPATLCLHQIALRRFYFRHLWIDVVGMKLIAHAYDA
jgi:hypothetical protein